MAATERRGWRERIEAGVYRAHRVGCASTRDRKAGRRCGCPFEVQVPGVLPGRTRTLTVHGSLTEAKAERRVLLAAGRPVVRSATGTGSFDELAGEVFRARAPVWAVNTTRNRDDDFRFRLSPVFGHLPLDQVDRHRIEAWLASLVASGSSRRMIEHSVATLRAILSAAVEWGRLSDNPALRLRLPRPDPEAAQAVRRVLSREQLAQLFDAAGSLRTRTMLQVAGEAGLRRGEITGLRWSDINLAARRLEVRRQVVQERLQGGGHRKVVGPPKGNRPRPVALSMGLTKALESWYRASIIDLGAAADSYVWPGEGGEPMHDRSLGRALERACDRAGFVEVSLEERRAAAKAAGLKRVSPPAPFVTPHGLRHSAASVWLLAGVPLTVVAAQLGHADPAITARIYAHLVDLSNLDLAAAVFDAPTGTMGGAMGALPR